MDTAEAWDGLGDCGWHTHTTESLYEIGDWGEPALQHRELYSVLCGDLNGKEIRKRGYVADVCIGIADSLFCTAETDTVL